MDGDRSPRSRIPTPAVPRSRVANRADALSRRRLSFAYRSSGGRSSGGRARSSVPCRQRNSRSSATCWAGSRSGVPWIGLGRVGREAPKEGRRSVDGPEPGIGLGRAGMPRLTKLPAPRELQGRALQRSRSKGRTARGRPNAVRTEVRREGLGSQQQPTGAPQMSAGSWWNPNGCGLGGPDVPAAASHSAWVVARGGELRSAGEQGTTRGSSSKRRSAPWAPARLGAVGRRRGAKLVEHL